MHQGYIRGQNIHGAPYDFRRAANENQEYFVKLKTLIEETYQKVNSTIYNCTINGFKDKFISFLIS